jgi:hypothetical protein
MTRKRNISNTAPTVHIPHSWTIATWPSDVFPSDSGKAKYLIREHRDELHRAGVLSRVGRELIIFGGPYARWLQKASRRVPDYPPPRLNQSVA